MALPYLCYACHIEDFKYSNLGNVTNKIDLHCVSNTSIYSFKFDIYEFHILKLLLIATQKVLLYSLYLTLLNTFE